MQFTMCKTEVRGALLDDEVGKMCTQTLARARFHIKIVKLACSDHSWQIRSAKCAPHGTQLFLNSCTYTDEAGVSYYLQEYILFLWGPVARPVAGPVARPVGRWAGGLTEGSGD